MIAWPVGVRFGIRRPIARPTISAIAIIIAVFMEIWNLRDI